ncbi:hypothetical protein JYU10_00065 [bacterium AH-315-J04]|nr:hypothetical protein [bacterium AH-315-J04]
MSAMTIGLLTFGASAFGQNPPGNTTFDLVPIGSTGTVSSLVGNDIVIPGGGVVVELELRISDWAATGDGGLLAVQATIDGTGYCSGTGDPLNPLGYPGAPVVACPQGSGCPVDGATCNQGGFINKLACAFSANAGDPCQVIGDCPGGVCAGNPLYVLDTFNPIDALAFPGLNYEYVGVSQAGAVPDVGLSEMFGTLLVEVPAGAVGTYSINFSADTERTFNSDGTAKSFAVVNLNGATITITAGSCCFNIGPVTTQCVDDVTQGACDGMTAPSLFRANEACPATGGLVPCPDCEQDSDCNDSNACTDDTCNAGTGICSNDDNFAVEDCCNPADGSLTTIEDFDVCTVDSCDPQSGDVLNDAVGAAGLTCDDGRACTVDDACDGVDNEANGGCSGTDVNTIACPIGDECPLGECDGDTSLCVCSEDTPLGFNFLDKFCASAGVACQGDADCPMGDTCVRGSFTDPNCYSIGDTVPMAVSIGSGSEEVAGGQFLIGYDNTCLQLQSVGPCAGSIFDNVISVEIDEAAGTIFYAATSDPAAPVSSPGPADMVCLNFTKIGDCNTCDVCLGDDNPRRTILTSITGNEVPLALTNGGCSKSVRDAGDLTISTPGDTDTNSDCNDTVANVTWNMPSADNSCEGPLSVTCSAQHSDGAIPQGLVDSWIAGGGDIPQGTAFFICSANDSCGSSQSNLWTVRVSDQQSLDVEVHVSPDMASGQFSRAITFDLYTDCSSDPTTYCEVLEFGGAFNFDAHAKASLKVNKANFSCVTAQDLLHTLRACATPECIGNSWTAQWKGDPLQGGNWLIGGNLDAAKPGLGHGNANTINIVDFGVYMSEIVAGASYAPRGDTQCDTAFPHGDINADGAVDTLDYTFLLENFLAESKNCCCPAPISASGINYDYSVSNKQLIRWGIGTAGDINNDGKVDMTDFTAVMQGGVQNDVIRTNKTRTR